MLLRTPNTNTSRKITCIVTLRYAIRPCIRFGLLFRRLRCIVAFFFLSFSFSPATVVSAKRQRSLIFLGKKKVVVGLFLLLDFIWRVNQPKRRPRNTCCESNHTGAKLTAAKYKK